MPLGERAYAQRVIQSDWCKTSAGRSALKGHNGALAAVLPDIGQQIVLQVAQPSSPAIAGASPNDPAMDHAAGH